jgi:hypothetical protein
MFEKKIRKVHREGSPEALLVHTNRLGKAGKSEAKIQLGV